jgi:tetratricopeptide (TPR) repeat protein
MGRFFVCVLLALLAVPALAQNPHDGYFFWLPAGELKIGDGASEKALNYSSTASSETFTLTPRSMRFGPAAGQFVIIRPGAKDKPDFTVDGKPGGTLGVVTFIPLDLTKGKEKVVVEVKAAPAKGGRYLIYYTDDADKLGTPVEGDLSVIKWTGKPASYPGGLVAFWKGDYKKAKSEFLAGVKAAPNPESARLMRRLARWADAYMKFPTVKSGPGFYNLGLYCMTNGFWDLAADCFKKATELMPTNPDAWYMLGDATSYKISDIWNMEAIYPYYKKAAELYPREGSNTFRTYFGLFKKLKLPADAGKTYIQGMTDEQIADVKKWWDQCSVIMEGASKGMLRMVNTYKVYDQEFDSTDVWSAKPFEGLFPAGTVDTFIKMTGWGASDACGMDCGPDRSAFINLGIRGWEVMLHEWNHTLDWAMISGELGIGVPVTHSSDWCGFQPISSMGMGHHSCNRYYMTPGMYQFMRGSDPVTTPYLTDWKCTASPVETVAPVTDELLKTGGKPADDFYADLRAKTSAAVPPPSDAYTHTPKVDNGYVDLGATYPNMPKNGYAFAECYVYSPVQQKVRMWIGADDNLRMWLNGKVIHRGVYWTCALWTEKKEKDQTAKGVMLEKGWNRLTVQVTNAQNAADWLGGAPPDAWGFSVRTCDDQNREVPGLKYQAERPAGYEDTPAFVLDPRSPQTYSWDKVGQDYTVLLPALTIEDLRAITGYKTMTASSDMLFELSKEAIDPALRPYVLDKSDPKNVAFNNELNWYFSPKELTAFIRYKRGNQVRDLVFIRPEGHESFLALLPVTKGAAKLGVKRQADQVIGYFMADYPDCPNGRGVIVLDTYLGDKPPTDEEDLLDIAALK